MKEMTTSTDHRWTRALATALLLTAGLAAAPAAAQNCTVAQAEAWAFLSDMALETEAFFAPPGFTNEPDPGTKECTRLCRTGAMACKKGAILSVKADAQSVSAFLKSVRVLCDSISERDVKRACKDAAKTIKVNSKQQLRLAMAAGKSACVDTNLNESCVAGCEDGDAAAATCAEAFGL